MRIGAAFRVTFLGLLAAAAFATAAPAQVVEEGAADDTAAATGDLSDRLRATWNAMKAAEQAEVRQFLRDTDNIKIIEPDILDLLPAGKADKAVRLVANIYHTSTRTARVVILLLASAHGLPADFR